MRPCALVGWTRKKIVQSHVRSFGVWDLSPNYDTSRALTAVVANIAIPHETCLDPRELSIQEQICLLKFAQTHHTPSNEQSIGSTGDVGNLALTHEWIADALLDLPDTVESAQSFAVEGLSPAEITHKDSLGIKNHRHTSSHGSPSWTDFNSSFRLSSPSLRPRKVHTLRRDDHDFIFRQSYSS